MPVAAQEDDSLLGNGLLDHPSEVGDGTCAPGAIGALELTTCSFPLTGDDDVLPEWPILAIIGAADYDDLQRRSECSVEGGMLICADLMGGWSDGEQDVWLSLDFERPRASVVIDRVNDGVLGYFGTFGKLPVAFTNAPREFGVFRSFMLDPGDEATLLVRKAGSDEVIAEVPALASGEEDGIATVVFPEPGRWTITSCLVDPAGGCAREGFRNDVQVINPVVEPLFEGHNLVGADRIDLVFVGSGWHGDVERFAEAARILLSFDGEPIRLFESGVAAEDEDPWGLAWGPFAIDPLRGETNLFNVWFLREGVSSLAFQRSPTIDVGIDLSPLGLGRHVAVVILARDLGYSSRRASAEWPSFWSDEPGELPPVEEIEFGSTSMPYRFDSFAPANTLSHEFGHLLFALADEYYRYDLGDSVIGYPNCAPSTAVAGEWWGDLLGEVDPMYDVWVAAERAAGTWYDSWSAEDFTVDVVEGGCFGGDSGAYRPTRSGLMNEESPVFGSVNRQRAEEVLALWTGRAPFNPEAHAELLEGVCDSDVVADGVRVVCSGIADARLDPPEAIGLEVDGGLASCAWIPRDGQDEIVCESVVIDLGATPTAAFVVGDVVVPLGTVGIPTTTTTTTTTVASTVAPEAAGDGTSDRAVPSGVLIGGVGLLVAAGALFGVQALASRLREE